LPVYVYVCGLVSVKWRSGRQVEGKSEADAWHPPPEKEGAGPKRPLPTPFLHNPLVTHSWSSRSEFVEGACTTAPADPEYFSSLYTLGPRAQRTPLHAQSSAWAEQWQRKAWAEQSIWKPLPPTPPGAREALLP